MATMPMENRSVDKNNQALYWGVGIVVAILLALLLMWNSHVRNDSTNQSTTTSPDSQNTNQGTTTTSPSNSGNSQGTTGSGTNNR